MADSTRTSGILRRKRPRRPGRATWLLVESLESRALLTSLSLGASPMMAAVGGTVKLYVDVSNLSDQSAIRSITLFDNNVQIASIVNPPSLRLSFPDSSLSAGSHVIRAVYSYDSSPEDDLEATLGGITVGGETVASTATFTQLAAPSASTYGDSTNFTATVEPVLSANAGQTPTGSVQFYVGGVATGDPVELIQGSASLSIGTLQAARDVVSAVYLPGSSSFSASVGAAPVVVSPRVLDVSASASDKVYDGTTSATVSLQGDSLPGDSITLTDTSATFATKNVGAAQLVTVTGLAIGGPDAGNYTLASQSAYAYASITPATVLAAVTVADKTYDGTTAATIIGRSLSGVLGTDSVEVVGGVAAFDDKDAGPDQVAIVSGLTLSGPDAADYVLTSTSITSFAAITPRVLTVTATASGKTYDGTVAATVSLADDQLPGDSIDLVHGPAFFDSAEAGDRTVTVPGLVIGGADAADYVLASTSITSFAAITPRVLTVTATASGKTYDGTVAATVSLADDQLPGDSIDLVHGPAFFDSAEAGDRTVTVPGLVIGGADAADYVLASTSITSFAAITPRVLTVTATASGKTYDGTVAATVSLADDQLPGDSIDLIHGPAVFDSAEAGDRTVTVPGLVIVGADAADYVLASSSVMTTAAISPATPAIAIVTSSSTPVPGQSIVLTARVAPVSASATIPAGSVQFSIDGKTVGLPVSLAGGSASIQIVAPPAGSHSVTVAYVPSGNDYGAASGILPGGLSVKPGGTVTTLFVSSNTALVGDPVTFKATVVSVGEGAPSPTGLVQFQVDGRDYGPPIPIGPTSQAVLTTSTLSKGSHTVAAIYVGVAGEFRPSYSRGASITQVTLVAGNGTVGSGGDGGLATQAQLNHPSGEVENAAGDLFIADTGNNEIREVLLDGTIETVAGTGAAGSGGDGGPATLAQLDGPTGVAVDAAGDLFIADTGNNEIREVLLDGTIETVAGTGAAGSGGDGGPATLAQLDSPSGLALDASGNLFIADTGNNRVRMIVGVTQSLSIEAIGGTRPQIGMIVTVAGTGVAGDAGDGGPATLAQLNHPLAVAVDTSGDLFIADTDNGRIQEVLDAAVTSSGGRPTSGTIQTIAGGGKAVVGSRPSGVAVDSSGNVYFSDMGLDRIVVVTHGNATTLIPASGDPVFDDPLGLTIVQDGTVDVANAGTNQVYNLDSEGEGTGGNPSGGSNAEIVVLGTGAALFASSSGSIQFTAQFFTGEGSTAELIGTLSVVTIEAGAASSANETSTSALPNQPKYGDLEETTLLSEPVNDLPGGAIASWPLIFHILGPGQSLDESLKGLLEPSTDGGEAPPPQEIPAGDTGPAPIAALQIRGLSAIAIDRTESSIPARSEGEVNQTDRAVSGGILAAELLAILARPSRGPRLRKSTRTKIGRQSPV